VDNPDFKKIGEGTLSAISQIMKNWCPFPDKAYCEMVGWIVNPDGTVDTPGGLTIPTSDLCEVEELEELYRLT